MPYSFTFLSWQTAKDPLVYVLLQWWPDILFLDMFPCKATAWICGIVAHILSYTSKDIRANFTAPSIQNSNFCNCNSLTLHLCAAILATWHQLTDISDPKRLVTVLEYKKLWSWATFWLQLFWASGSYRNLSFPWTVLIHAYLSVKAP